MPENAKEPAPLDIHYIKSNFFRVIHADGAYGGITPNGYVQISFYNERKAIPRHTIIEFDAATRTPQEKIVDAHQGIVREIEAGIMMDERATAALIVWLQDKLGQLRELSVVRADLESKGADDGA